MNDRRSIESWRIVSVWPSPPKITSWWATRPGRRTEWIGSWTLPPGLADQLRGPLRRPRRRVELAVVVKLDDLASGMWRAASAAICIISTAPIAKFGATKHVRPAARRLARPARAARRGRTRWCRPRRGRRRRGRRATLSSAVVRGREVDHDVGAVEDLAERRVERRIGTAGELQVLGALTASQTVSPIRPAAPRHDDPDHARRAAPAHAGRPDASADGAAAVAEAVLVGPDAGGGELAGRRARRRARRPRRR